MSQCVPNGPKWILDMNNTPTQKICMTDCLGGVGGSGKRLNYFL